MAHVHAFSQAACSGLALLARLLHGRPHTTPLVDMMRKRIAWRLALTCWTVRLERLGNHFEDVAFCGKRWL